MQERFFEILGWAVKSLWMSCLGLFWVMGPSIAAFTVGTLLAPYTGWSIETVKMASINAFIIWMSVHTMVFLFDHYVSFKIRKGIEAYHEEFNALKNKYKRLTGQDGTHETITSIKEKLS